MKTIPAKGTQFNTPGVATNTAPIDNAAFETRSSDEKSSLSFQDQKVQLATALIISYHWLDL